MHIEEQIVPYELFYPITKQYAKEEMVFFDIETTGLSAHESYVYLIGCVYYSNHTFYLKQWFSEGVAEERDLLCYFFEFIKPYRLLIHYNGTGFDLPYLSQKLKHYNLSYDFKDIDSFDIYKKIIPYKKRLPLADLKLKTLQQFFQMKRKDLHSGGDLIAVYIKYLAYRNLEKKHVGESSLLVEKQSGLPLLGSGSSHECLRALLLHNAEDVMGLLVVASILSYVEVFQGNFQVKSATMQEDQLLLQLAITYPLTVPIKDTLELPLKDKQLLLTLQAKDGEATLSVPFHQGELKYFFENYKDYYYLPYEDTAIHKSVGEYVEKAYRQNAKPNNCYQKKSSTFLPQKGVIYSPAFYMNYKDKISWFEPSEAWLSDLDQLTEYIQRLWRI